VGGRSVLCWRRIFRRMLVGRSKSICCGCWLMRTVHLVFTYECYACGDSKKRCGLWNTFVLSSSCEDGGLPALYLHSPFYSLYRMQGDIHHISHKLDMP
jgi:hypothetical protein